MRFPVLLLIVLVALAFLMSLGGCLATNPSASPVPWMFYQAYDERHKDAPAPFFLTIEEAQEYCTKMNKQSENNYQVSFISR